MEYSVAWVGFSCFLRCFFFTFFTVAFSGKNCLKEKGIKQAEIDGYLKKKGLSKKDVFCMTIADGKYTLIPYERSIKKK